MGSIIRKSYVGTERIRQIARSRSQDPENAVENTAVIHSRDATRLVGQHGLDDGPLVIIEFVTHDSPLSLRV